MKNKIIAGLITLFIPLTIIVCYFKFGDIGILYGIMIILLVALMGCVFGLILTLLN